MPAPPTRVLHLIKSLGRGGAEVLLSEGLAVADRERFDYAYAYFLPWKDAMVPELRAQGAEVTCFDARSNAAILARVPRLVGWLRRKRIGLIHAHLPIAGVAARLAGRLAGIPVVYTEHNLQERYHAVTRHANLRTWRLQQQAIAVSSDVEASIRRHAPPSVPVRTVLNGVNTRTYAPGVADGTAVRAEWGIPEGAPVVGTVAVFRTQKCLPDWVAVAARVLAACPEVHFLIVGEGPERPALEAAIAAHGLAERIHLVGLQEETRPYFAAMDVYLMTSQFEGLPIALLEAMAMGTAPVLTAVGGIPEAVEAGTHGLLCDFGDVAGIAGAVVELVGDPDRRARLADAARARVAVAFSMERMQGELEAMYTDVVGGLQAPR